MRPKDIALTVKSDDNLTQYAIIGNEKEFYVWGKTEKEKARSAPWISGPGTQITFHTLINIKNKQEQIKALAKIHEKSSYYNFLVDMHIDEILEEISKETKSI